jgi:hypothetical protein
VWPGLEITIMLVAFNVTCTSGASLLSIGSLGAVIVGLVILLIFPLAFLVWAWRFVLFRCPSPLPLN